jgi:hypothetical protein
MNANTLEKLTLVCEKSLRLELENNNLKKEIEEIIERIEVLEDLYRHVLAERRKEKEKKESKTKEFWRSK